MNDETLTPDGSPPARSHEGARLLPFSRRLDDAELERLADELARSLELPARARIVRGDAESGLESERRFRLAWWAHGVEPLRAALQRAKVRAHREARAAGRESELTRGWKRAEQVVSGDVWRGHLRGLVAGRGEAEAAYLRTAFRFAQQAWSRAARWRAAGGVALEESARGVVLEDAARGVVLEDAARGEAHEEKTRGVAHGETAGEFDPFAPLVELLGAGAWPLGCSGGVLWVYVWDEARGRASEFAAPADAPADASAEGGARGEHIFLSALFRDAAITEGWRARLHANGWPTVYGPVSEAETPPEVQLGCQIRAARAVVGIVREVDADFGLPWWMFQELDYARACRRPVYLITERPADEAVVRRHVRPFLLPPDARTATPDERAVWSWLALNAPHNGGR